MTMPSLLWGSPHWAAAALAVSFLAAFLIFLSYGRAQAKRSVRIGAAALKALAFAALAISLLEPLLAGVRPRKGANVFVVLADNSQSLLIRGEEGAPRAASGCATCSAQNRPGRRAWAKISTCASMPSTRTSAQSTASTP